MTDLKVFISSTLFKRSLDALPCITPFKLSEELCLFVTLLTKSIVHFNIYQQNKKLLFVDEQVFVAATLLRQILAGVFVSSPSKKSKFVET